jgi:glycosyltransferase involved in cell wall biosynthesis
MKIIQISSSDTNTFIKEDTGPQGVILNLSRQLTRLGHEVSILTRGYSRKNERLEQPGNVEVLSLKTCRLPSCKFPRPFELLEFVFGEINLFLYAFAVRNYLGKNHENIDVIHVHLPSLGILLVVLNRELRSRIFYTCHVGNWALPPDRLNILQRITLSADAWLMRRVNKVIAGNDAARERFISQGKVEPNKVVVIPNGVDTDLFRPDTDIEAISEKYGLKDKISVLFIGLRIKIKGIQYLLKAADILVNDMGYRNVYVILVAAKRPRGIDEPIDTEFMLDFIRQRNIGDNIRVTERLPRDDIRKLYVATDIFVLPSLVEADPLVTIEAMASGKPLIGTKVGGIPRHIRDGWNGFLVDPADEKQLADRIKYLIDNPEERKRMGANSRRYAVEEFDWSKVGQRVLSVYQTLS